MAPLVLNEQAIRPFSYWRDGIQSGMRYGSTLYSLYLSFPPADWLNAYNQACALSVQQIPVCVSYSSTQCVIWVDLRCGFTEAIEFGDAIAPLSESVKANAALVS